MADIIRQVEVHCGERGRALAFVWNTFLVTNDKTMSNFQTDNRQLKASNAQVNGLRCGGGEAVRQGTGVCKDSLLLTNNKASSTLKVYTGN